MKLVLIQNGNVIKEVAATHNEYTKLRAFVETSQFKWEIYLQRPCVIKSIDAKLLHKWNRYVSLHGSPDYGHVDKAYKKKKINFNPNERTDHE